MAECKIDARADLGGQAVIIEAIFGVIFEIETGTGNEIESVGQGDPGTGVKAATQADTTFPATLIIDRQRQPVPVRGVG